MVRHSLILTLVAAMFAFPTGRACAQEGAKPEVVKPDAIKQEPVKVGIVMPMTGAFAHAGRQVLAGIRLYVQEHGDAIAGRRIQLIVKDDASLPDVSKRMAQELIVVDKVNLIGAGLTPNALALAPLALEARIPTILMISGTSFVTEKSPYIVRTSFTLGQQSGIIADWAAQNGSHRAVVVQSDFAPGAEAATVFMDRFAKGGGQILENIKVPRSPTRRRCHADRPRAC
jgi:branched-chain amino acid transport system substrate-binding protein